MFSTLDIFFSFLEFTFMLDIVGRSTWYVVGLVAFSLHHCRRDISVICPVLTLLSHLTLHCMCDSSFSMVDTFFLLQLIKMAIIIWGHINFLSCKNVSPSILASIDNPSPDQFIDGYKMVMFLLTFFIFTFFVLSITMDSLVITTITVIIIFDANLTHVWLMGAPSG